MLGVLSTRFEPSLNGLRGGLLIAALLVFSGLLLAGSNADTAALRALNGLSPACAVTASSLSVLGLGASAVLLAGLVGVRRPAVPAAVLIAVLGGGLLVQALKWLFGVPRPVSVLDPQTLWLVGAALHGRSMPSGHAALFGALLAMAWLAPWCRQRPVRRQALLATLSLVAVAGALARVVVAAHWLSDVLVGVGCGVIVGSWLVGSARGRSLVSTGARWLGSRAGSRTMSAVLVATAAALWVAPVDYPLAAGLQVAVAVMGLVAATLWWRLHPGPGRRVVGPVAWRRAKGLR